MADDVTLPATGAAVGTDEVDLGGGLVHVQYVKLVDGTEEGTGRIPGSAARGLEVDPKALVTRVGGSMPGTSTTAYAAKDAVGTGLTLANVNRSSGRPVVLQSLLLRDVDQVDPTLDVLIFDTAVASVTDNAAFDPTDAELLNLLACVPIVTADSVDLSDNAFSFRGPLGIDLLPAGTDLFVYFVAREAMTYASASPLHLTATFLQV